MDVPASPPTTKQAVISSPIKQLNFKASSSVEEDNDVSIESNELHLSKPEQMPPSISKEEEVPIDSASSNNKNSNSNNNNNDNLGNNNSLVHNNHNQDQGESKIKLKRCRHGRIIIKDLSKKKLAQQNLTGGADKLLDKQDPVESNNNTDEFHDIEEQDSETVQKEPQSDQSLRPQLNSPTVKENFRISPPYGIDPNNRVINDSTDERQIKMPPKTPDRPDRSSSRRRRSKSKSPNQTRKTSKNRHHSPRRSRIRSGSRGRSCSRSVSRGRSPSSRIIGGGSRHSRSPHTRRDVALRVTKRDRSPRIGTRKDREPRRKAHGRSPSRERIFGGSRHHRTSHIKSSSPRRHRSHSRSLTPKRDDDIGKRRRNISPSPADDQYTRDRYRARDLSPSPRRHNNLHSRRYVRSPISDRRPHEESSRAINPVSTDEVDNDSRGPLVASSSLGELLSANQQLQQQQQRHSTPPNPTEMEPASPQRDFSPSAQSPSILFNEDSASSDIYDPAGPIIPISPGDSPPLSPLHESSYQGSPHDQSLQRPVHKKDVIDKDGRDDDIIPSSAVQLNQQEKYLQKLNRQERVIEEVKLALKPYYSNRTIDKEQYKDVLRRAVPKICHNKNGEINPIKISSLVEAYIKKMKHH